MECFISFFDEKSIRFGRLINFFLSPKRRERLLMVPGLMTLSCDAVESLWRYWDTGWGKVMHFPASARWAINLARPLVSALCCVEGINMVPVQGHGYRSPPLPACDTRYAPLRLNISVLIYFHFTTVISRHFVKVFENEQTSFFFALTWLHTNFKRVSCSLSCYTITSRLQSGK